jgi:adenosine deaminase-related growth factor
MKRTIAAGMLAVIAAAAQKQTNQGYSDVAQYKEARARLIEEERALRQGAAVALTPEEESANRRLMALKQAELERTRAHFPPAHSFLKPHTKRVMHESPVLEVMRRLPKGGLLHAHGAALGDFRRLVAQATYRSDCYIYAGRDAQVVRGALRVAAQPPGEGWRRVVDVRAEAADAKAFDEELYRSLTLGEEDLDAPDIWQEFSNCFRRVSGLFASQSVYADYWRDTLGRLIDDNVQYLESRSVPFDESIVREARRRDPGFDVKFIPVAGRSSTRERMAKTLSAVAEQHAKAPDRVKGFDLVDEEDRTNTNLFYLPELLGTRVPLYLHSGESNRAENENLYDAVLLGARRIGHGIALVKHPRLMQMVRERNIAIEACPISNQILRYVPDLRNHPAATFINAGLPVVLSTDDPAIMGQTLSHDFYVAFMAWGLDLRDLKQLAMNSLLHSAMDEAEKQKALASWRERWTAFIAWLNARPDVTTTAPPVQPNSPIEIKVVLVTMFEHGADTGDRAGEFQYWVEREKLDEVLPFPAGFRDLRLNAGRGILGIVTGAGVTNATAAIMALGADPRFDLSKAYWLVAGIAGVDPDDASIGSAAWASYVLDGDLVREFDARESPAGWPYGRIAIGAKGPNQLPAGPRSETVLYELNRPLAEWAYSLTRNVALADTPEAAALRARYKKHPNARRPPFVLKGDSLGASTFWHGRILNQWANDWAKLWTKGQGNYVMTNMEDNGTANALQRLAKTGRADYNRLLILRTGSNYSMPPPGMDAASSILAPYVGLVPSLEAAYRVGSTVVHELVDNWAKWEYRTPAP